MNITLLSISLGLLLFFSTASINAESINLTNAQMDMVSAGLGYSRSASLSQSGIDSGFLGLKVVTLVQGDSTAVAESSTVDTGHIYYDSASHLEFAIPVYVNEFNIVRTINEF